MRPDRAIAVRAQVRAGDPVVPQVLSREGDGAADGGVVVGGVGWFGGGVGTAAAGAERLGEDAGGAFGFVFRGEMVCECRWGKATGNGRTNQRQRNTHLGCWSSHSSIAKSSSSSTSPSSLIP